MDSVRSEPLLALTMRRLCRLHSDQDNYIVNSDSLFLDLVTLDWSPVLQQALSKTDVTEMMFMVAGTFYLAPDRSVSVVDCPPLQAICEALSVPRLENTCCDDEFCAAFSPELRLDSFVDCNYAWSAFYKVKTRPRSWCLRRNRLLDGERIRYLPKIEGQFAGLLVAHFVENHTDRWMGFVKDMTLLLPPRAPPLPPLVLRESRDLPPPMTTPDSDSQLFHKIYLRQERVPQSVQKKCAHLESFRLAHEIKRPRIVEKLTFRRLEAFRKISVDERNQLWNAHFLMDLWYDEDPTKQETITVHFRLPEGSVCKECQPEGQWQSRDETYDLSQSRLLVCRHDFCNRCLLTPLVTYEFPEWAVKEVATPEEWVVR